MKGTSQIQSSTSTLRVTTCFGRCSTQSTRSGALCSTHLAATTKQSLAAHLDLKDKHQDLQNKNIIVPARGGRSSEQKTSTHIHLCFLGLGIVFGCVLLVKLQRCHSYGSGQVLKFRTTSVAFCPGEQEMLVLPSREQVPLQSTANATFKDFL